MYMQLERRSERSEVVNDGGKEEIDHSYHSSLAIIDILSLLVHHFITSFPSSLFIYTFDVTKMPSILEKENTTGLIILFVISSQLMLYIFLFCFISFFLSILSMFSPLFIMNTLSACIWYHLLSISCSTKVWWQRRDGSCRYPLRAAVECTCARKCNTIIIIIIIVIDSDSNSNSIFIIIVIICSGAYVLVAIESIRGNA